MDLITAWDTALFLSVNRLPHSFFSDQIAMFFSGIGSWGAVWFVIAIVLFLREEKRDHRFFIPFVFVGLAGSVCSEWLFKWIVARPRPSLDIGAVILTNPGNFSFPSTHATLAWAMAVVLSREEPKLRFWFYLLALLISVSRVYLGVHYPLDILGGGLFGWAIGSIAMHAERLFGSRPRHFKPARRKTKRV